MKSLYFLSLFVTFISCGGNSDLSSLKEDIVPPPPPRESSLSIEAPDLSNWENYKLDSLKSVQVGAILEKISKPLDQIRKFKTATFNGGASPCVTLFHEQLTRTENIYTGIGDVDSHSFRQCYEVKEGDRKIVKLSGIVLDWDPSEFANAGAGPYVFLLQEGSLTYWPPRNPAKLMYNAVVFNAKSLPEPAIILVPPGTYDVAVKTPNGFELFHAKVDAKPGLVESFRVSNSQQMVKLRIKYSDVRKFPRNSKSSNPYISAQNYGYNSQLHEIFGKELIDEISVVPEFADVIVIGKWYKNPIRIPKSQLVSGKVIEIPVTTYNIAPQSGIDFYKIMHWSEPNYKWESLYDERFPLGTSYDVLTGRGGKLKIDFFNRNGYVSSLELK